MPDTKVRPGTRRPDLDTMFTVNPDGSRNMINVADVAGRWQRRKHVVWFVLIAVYLALPFVQIGGHPAVHIDLPGRAAYIFGLTFTNQDFYLSFFLFTAIWFVLFVATALWGRVWCGYACPQTVFLEGVFRRVQRAIEGSREKRARVAGKVTFPKIVTHTIFLLLSSILAHAFVAYFIPVQELLGALTKGPAEHMTAFVWVTVWTGILYADYSWFREQTCLILCPYGRLQSALVDADTVVIGYDEKRGEPRTKKMGQGGDCIDCFRCVAVCPTGIDIRNGLQLECIGCANCIDACDAIMEKVGRPKGLIRYDSRVGFETGRRRSIFRPRVFVYAAFGVAGLVVASLAISNRADFTVNPLRSRGLPYSLVEDKTVIRNVYNISIQNKTDREASFAVTNATTDDSSAIDVVIAQPEVEIAPMATAVVPIVAERPRADHVANVPLRLDVTHVGGKSKSVELTFRGP